MYVRATWDFDLWLLFQVTSETKILTWLYLCCMGLICNTLCMEYQVYRGLCVNSTRQGSHLLVMFWVCVWRVCVMIGQQMWVSGNTTRWEWLSVICSEMMISVLPNSSPSRITPRICRALLKITGMRIDIDKKTWKSLKIRNSLYFCTEQGSRRKQAILQKQGNSHAWD